MTTFHSAASTCSSSKTFEISLSLLTVVKAYMALSSYVFWLMDDLQERLLTLNMEVVYPAHLLECTQRTFLLYKLCHFLRDRKRRWRSITIVSTIVVMQVVLGWWKS